MNCFTCIGRFVEDPELHYTPSGVAVSSFRLAVDKNIKRDGQTNAEFVNFKAWEKTAELICKWFKKGKPIVIEDSEYETETWDKEGVKHYKVVMRVNRISFCPTNAKDDNSSEETGRQQNNAPARGRAVPEEKPNNRPQRQTVAPGPVETIDDDDIPF